MTDTSHPSDTDLKAAIGRTILSARIEAGLHSQAALARVIDVTTQYISRVEGGEENLTLETLVGIARGVGLSLPDFLLRVVEEIRNPSPPSRLRRGRPRSR